MELRDQIAVNWVVWRLWVFILIGKTPFEHSILIDIIHNRFVILNPY